jgi:NNP family nitrate/nitrite transporter-like MFS transporter
MMKLAAFGAMKEGVAKQFAIFRNKHTWSLTILYIVTFGSFIGFSMALPLSMKVIFGVSHVPDAAGVMQHTAGESERAGRARLCLDRSLRRRHRAADRRLDFGQGRRLDRHPDHLRRDGRRLRAVGYIMMQAYASATPEQYFAAFMWLFVVLFAASGIGNGSTFRTIGVIFDRQQAGPVLGWTSAVAAYGAFIAPVIIGQQITAGTPQLAMYGFAVFYALCLILNWWFYLRAGSEIKNP